jgi:mono/diheme cytochrome c family protein
MKLRLLLLVLVGFLAGCGGGDDAAGDRTTTTTASPTTTAAPTSLGAKIFAGNSCGFCHTFSPAGSTGTEGPNLDESDISFKDAAHQVRNGSGGMPSFGDELSDKEVEAVARYVTQGGR